MATSEAQALKPCRTPYICSQVEEQLRCDVNFSNEHHRRHTRPRSSWCYNNRLCLIWLKPDAHNCMYVFFYPYRSLAFACFTQFYIQLQILKNINSHHANLLGSLVGITATSIMCSLCINSSKNYIYNIINRA